jgi:Uma2 family endonuclease
MSVARINPWTAERFLSWVQTQEGRYEFDASRPVAMTGGSARHSRIIVNTHVAPRSRLRGPSCSSFGPDLGVRTIGNAIRYSDVLVSCTKFEETELLAPDPLIVFEVLSADSGRRDRIEKAQEYGAVPSIRQYIILESAGIGLLVLHGQRGNDAWAEQTPADDNTLGLPEIGIEIPVAELYEDLDFGDAAPGG